MVDNKKRGHGFNSDASSSIFNFSAHIAECWHTNISKLTERRRQEKVNTLNIK